MTPEKRAEKRYPAPKYVPLPEGLDEIYAPDVRHTKQFAYADCIREQVEPLEAKVIEQSNALADAYDTMMSYREEIDGKSAEVAKLRALVQELVDTVSWQRGITKGLNDEGMHIESEFLDESLDAAKEEGFVPTNTEDK